ncbi:MAG: glycosyltransferase 87 family protein, partial [Alphaproteobacteria bacterium]
AFVPGYGSLDAVPAFMSLAAVLCRVRRRLWLAGLLLGCGVLVKFYPLILLPFLMYERRRLLWAPALACAGLVAAGMGVSFLLWGESTLNPILLAQDRPGAMLSIFRVIAAHPEISRALFGAADVSWASIYLMGLAGGTVWAVAAWRNLPVVEASMLGFLAVLTSYKVGNQQFLLTFVLLAAYSVASVSRVSRVTFRPLFGVLIYLLFLEGFQVLYVFTRWLSPPWNAALDFLGLPTFVLALIAMTTGLLFMEAGRDDKTASPGPRPP